MISKIIKRIKLLFSKDKELYFLLHDILGFYPQDITHYRTALMHRSIMHKNKNGKYVNNERLEFLGDAILDAVVADVVYHQFPHKKEGFLTNTRSKVVQRESLNKIAHDLGIDRLVLSSGRSYAHNSYMGGNALEALVGAIYVDKGYHTCARFIKERIIHRNVDLKSLAYKEVNFKSRLIEWGQKNKVQLDFVLTKQEKDEDGNSLFEFTVHIEGIEAGSGKGYSKKEGHQMAAENTMRMLRKDKEFAQQIIQKKAQRLSESDTLSAQEESVPPTDASQNDITDHTPSDSQPAVLAPSDDRVKTIKQEVKREKTKEDIIAEAESSAFALTETLQASDIPAMDEHAVEAGDDCSHV